MNLRIKYIFKSLAIIVLIAGVLSCSSDGQGDFSDVVKVALRDVGHQLLLANQDSTSLVKPVVVLDELKYQLAFESKVSIHPDSLVAIVKSSFQKADLPQNYLTEVIQCEDQEVWYSYEMKQNMEKGIIPCRGRVLPESCFTIIIRFTEVPGAPTASSNYIYLLVFGVLAVLTFLFFRRNSTDTEAKNYSSLGRFKFYPDQNKLIKEATEIGLSRIECELLAIFVAQPNQTIKRDFITKKVWEDNGVIVGRSLDTYISKLRKKLQDDDSIKITNVHGVVYKLEINQ